MTLAIPKFELSEGYEGYRKARRKILEIYAFSLLEKYRELKRVVCIATEPRSKIVNGGSSEDLIVIEPGEWTPEFLKQLKEAKNELNIMQKENFKPYVSSQEPEFPNVRTIDRLEPDAPRLNRKQRRALAAKRKKK
jgi:hypothetical protein